MKYNKSDNRKQEFLLTFFSKPDRSEHKKVNGFVLNKYFSNSTHKWEVMIYTSESWEKAQTFLFSSQFKKPYLSEKLSEGFL